MRKIFAVAIVAAMCVMSPGNAAAVSPTADELAKSRQWAAAKFETGVEPFFSFTYNGKPSAELLKTWEAIRASRRLDDRRSEHTTMYTDPKTGLVLRCVAIEYRDYPTVEWTLYFKKMGKQESPILANIQALDVTLHRGQQREFLLHHQAGSQANSDDYRPLETELRPEATAHFAPQGGWASSEAWPYYNLQWEGEGLMIAVGWPGQWAANFSRDKQDGLHVTAGQETTHFKLLPDEEVRSPLMALQFWKGGDWIRAQNVWRRWMMAHNMPRPGGKLPPPLLAAGSSGQFNEMTAANEDNQKLFIDRYLDLGIKIDFWWMDAGWYVNKTGWPNVGTWEVDRQRFPHGLRAVTDHAHARGVNALLWFEPERVTPGTWLYENRKPWLLGSDGRQKLFYYGIPAAQHWMAGHVLKLMKDEGIDIYRQDFNFPPLDYWRNNDAPDRKGITEIRHCVGYLAYWDELRRRRPNMLTDECASGGRRNDLESMRRAVPLHKSDMDYGDLEAKHTQFYGLSLWHPYFATGTGRVDSYAARTAFAPLLGLGYDVRRDDIDFALVRKFVDEWREVAPYYYGDFYPLTSWTYALDTWMAWQFDRPEEGQGLVQAFRRPRSNYTAARFKLRGLDPQATYALKNDDTAGTIEINGRELLDQGLSVIVKDRPGAVVITYKKKTQ